MSNQGKVWDIREAYKKQRANEWIEPGNIGLYGGENSILNTVEQINISNNGNATDFGDLTEAIKKGAAAGALTRTVRCGGNTPSDTNTMDFANPFNAGNFVNFGDLGRTGQTTNNAHSNNVRGIAGAQASSNDTLDVFLFYDHYLTQVESLHQELQIQNYVGFSLFATLLFVMFRIF